MTFLCKRRNGRKYLYIYSKITKLHPACLGIFRQNHTPCLGIFFGEKVTHFSVTPPYTLLGEYPPPPPPGDFIEILRWHLIHPLIFIHLKFKPSVTLVSPSHRDRQYWWHNNCTHFFFESSERIEVDEDLLTANISGRVEFEYATTRKHDRLR